MAYLYITQTVDFLLEDRLESFKLPDIPDCNKESLEKQLENYQAELDKAKKTLKNLNSYEMLLKKTEN